MNTADVIHYILASSKFGARTPWG